VTGDVEAEQFLFGCEHFALRPFRQLMVPFTRGFLLLSINRAKERRLSALFILQKTGGSREGAINVRKHGGAIFVQRIARATLDQRFERFPVEAARIHTFAQVEERFESASVLSRFQDRLHRNFSDAFDRRQSKANDCPLTRRRESDLAFIDVRRQHFDAERFGLLNENADLAGVAHVIRQHRAEEFNRVIGFQVSRLIRDNGVSRGVRLVESITCELLEQVKNLIRFCRWNFVNARGALNENLPLAGHFLGLFFAHGAAQQIRASERVTGEDLSGLHYLLLVN